MAKTTVTAPGIADDAVTVDKLPNTSVTNAKLANSSITINGTEVSLGGTITGVGVEDFPTVTAVSPTVITNAQTTVTITGTNFVSVPIVEAINTSGAITTADSVTYVSATSVQAAFTLAVDGTYFIRVENDYKNTKMSKYIMAYFVGHLIKKYTPIPIQLQNATNNTIIFNVKSCKRMRTQVKSLSTRNFAFFPNSSNFNLLPSKSFKEL